jgi:ATP-binding cassette subfamily C protein
VNQVKYQCILQHTEEDCGAACLASVAKHYGRSISLNQVREAVGTGQLGTTLLGLRRGAEALGLNARAARTSSELLDQMREVPLPAIIHWKGYHWVVLYGQRGKKYAIADPAVGIRYLSRKEIQEGWTSYIMLLLEPDQERFFGQQDEKIGGFGRFLKRAWPYRTIIAQALLINFFLGLLSLAYPFLIQILTDDVLVRSDTKLLTGVVIAVVVMRFVSSSLGLVQSNLIAHFAQRLELGLVLEFGRAILRLPLTYYESRRSGEIVSRMRDIQEINQLVSQGIISLPSQFFIAVVSFSFMLFYSWKLTLIATLIAVVMTLSTLAFLPTLQQKTRSLLVLEAENQGVLVETFKGALTLKTTTAAPQFWEELQSRFSRLATVTFGTIQINIVNNVFSGLVSGIGSVVLLWFGSTLVIGKELTIGQLLAFNSMDGNFLSFIGTVIGFVNAFTLVKTATERLTEVIDSKTETEDDTYKPFAEITGDDDIICTNLKFHHTGRVDLLEDFSLTIPGGKVIALIGKSGCGKSTLAKLIAGLYSPQSGNIRVGIYNLQDLSLDCLRQQVILVPQEPHFWSRSIIENFRLGSPHVTFESIVRACQIAEADEFISKLPDKYQTVLGEFGANISGGQRQRLAIARAIVTAPPILILDESTASLDPVSEAQVLERLLYYRQGKTTILISHRPRVINRADWIVLLNQGKLLIQGSLEELRSQPGEHLDFLSP